MRKHLSATSLFCLIIATPALAQNTTAVGTGISGAEANSAAGAVAINRGNGSSNSSLTVNNPANTTSTANVNSNVSGTTTSNINQRVSGSTTVKSAPPIAAPSLAAAGLETCLGSASGGVSWLGTGIVGGSTYVDPGCEARLDSRTLASWGLKSAAVARICQQPKVWNSMPDVCQQYWPRGVAYPYGVVVVAPVGYNTEGLPMRMSASGGSVETIRVVNGKTGVEGDCLNYSHSKQKCYQWAGEPRQRTAAVSPTKKLEPIVVKPRARPAAMPVQTAKPPVEPQPVEPKPEDKKT